MRGDDFGTSSVNDKFKVIIRLEKADLGCFEDCTKTFCGNGLELTSHQKTMLASMTPNRLLERPVLKKIDVGNRVSHCNGSEKSESWQAPSRGSLGPFWKKFLGVVVVSWHGWTNANVLAWEEACGPWIHNQKAVVNSGEMQHEGHKGCRQHAGQQQKIAGWKCERKGSGVTSRSLARLH